MIPTDTLKQMTLPEHSHDCPIQNAYPSTTHLGLYDGPSPVCTGNAGAIVPLLRQDEEVTFPQGPRFTTRTLKLLRVKEWLITTVGKEGEDWITQRLSKMPGGMTVDMVRCKLESDNLMCHMTFIDYLAPVRKLKKR
jgi:hypothetical protein